MHGVQTPAVALAAAPETNHAQTGTNKPGRRGPVFQMEGAVILPEYLRFSLPFNAESLAGVNRAEPQAQAVLQEFILVFRCASLAVIFLPLYAERGMADMQCGKP